MTDRYHHIIVDRPLEHVERITLNRVDRHNAQDWRLLYELNHAFDAASQDAGVKVIVLAANGKNFSAGHDLSGDNVRDEVHLEYPQVTTASRQLQTAPGAEGRMAKEEEAFVGFCKRWRGLPKVTIAQVQGKCIAAGLMLCWPCDLIIASDDAQFSDVTVALGICGVEYFGHPWEFGSRKAKQMLFTGAPISASEAHQLGMVNEVFPRCELERRTLELAASIARQPLFTLKTVKMAVNAAEDAQGRSVAMDTAFALHQLGHSHSQEVHGMAIDPSGIRSGVRKVQ
jgi:enoyl-CoA hydratase